jgi:WD40 repeat protein
MFVALATIAGCVTSRPPSQEKAFSTVAFSTDNSLLAFANATEIRVLEVETLEPIITLRRSSQDTETSNLPNFRHGVGDTLVFLDDQRIATTGMGGLVSIWSTRSGDRLSVIDPPNEEIFASTLDYSPSTNRLIIGTADGNILLTNIHTDIAGPLLPIAKLEGYIWDLQFGQKGQYFASASMTAKKGTNGLDEETGSSAAAGQIQPVNTSNVSIWDAESLEKVGDLDGANDVYQMALAPNERALLTAGDELRIWEFLTLEQAGELTDPSMVMQGIGVGTIVAVSVLGLAAGAAVGAPFMAFDPFTATQLMLMPAGLAFRPETCMRSVAISPDGKTVVSTTKGPLHNVMAVIDRASDKVVDKWKADTYVCDMEFSPNGKYLVTATNTGVQIYDTTNWKKTNINTPGAE